MVIVNSGLALVLRSWGERVQAWQRPALGQLLGIGGMAADPEYTPVAVKPAYVTQQPERPSPSAALGRVFRQT